ncbi:MAG: A/G-specific adenine glycosylase [Christensenellaceae bacterium]
MEYQEQILAFQPHDEEEQATKSKTVTYINQFGRELLLRKNKEVHLVSSALILNPTLDKVLMVRHHLYKAYTFVGGHTDGKQDLIAVAAKEIKEETGLSYFFCLDDNILSLDILPVKQHIRQGKNVPLHKHICVTYGFIAPENQPVAINEKENSAVEWIFVNELQARCSEKHMLPIYQKVIERMKKIVKKRDRDLEICEMVLPLLAWYDKHARILPWRENIEAYRVWVSEIMLQQTRVEAVKPYFDRFMSELPTLKSLAEADDEKLLKLWEGLGYYNRVRNLKKAAQMVMQEYNGEFPRQYHQLLKLSGIGTYTAGAICSISFGKPVPAVDGNVLRVLARVMCSYDEITDSKVKAQRTQLLQEFYPVGRSGDFTQALMELGAMVCVPNGSPKCKDCPLCFLCKAYQTHTQEELPIKTKKKARKKEKKTIVLLCCDGQTAIKKRNQTGLLSGMWEFPNVSGLLTQVQLEQVLEQWQIKPKTIIQSMDKKHVFTHIEWEMSSYLVLCKEKNGDFLWVTKRQLEEEFALPTAFKAFSKVLPLEMK